MAEAGIIGDDVLKAFGRGDGADNGRISQFQNAHYAAFRTRSFAWLFPSLVDNARHHPVPMHRGTKICRREKQLLQCVCLDQFRIAAGKG